MKKLIFAFFLLSNLMAISQVGWIDTTVLTTKQKEAVTFLGEHTELWEAQGTIITKYKAKYSDKSNDITDLTLRRTVVLPGITIPAFIGGKIEDDNRFGFQLNPLAGFGLTFRRESISTDGAKVFVRHNISFQLMMLFYKYSIDKNRYGGVYGANITFFNYLQIGYGYSDYKMPNYQSHDLFLIGVTVPVEGLFPAGERNNGDTKKK